MKDENIFESVQFINEGVLGFLAGCVLVNISLPIILIGVALAVSSIESADSRGKIKKELAKALKERKELSVLKDKMKNDVSIITPDELSKYINISNKDLSIIKDNDVTVMAIFDKKNKIIAYCLVDTKGKMLAYGYTIVDKSIGTSEVVNKYIRALFELKIGVVGEGIKYFVKNPSYFINMKSKDEKELESKASYLPKEEAEKIYKTLQKLAYDIYKMLVESKIQDMSVHKPAKFERYDGFYIDIVSDIENVNFADSNNEDKETRNKLKGILNNAMKKLGFEQYGEVYKSNDDKYKYIYVDLDYVEENDDEEYGGWYISICCTRKLNYK